MEGPQYRVNWVFGGIMIGIAVIADCAQFLLDLTVAFSPFSDLITLMAEGLIGFFFLICGVSFVRGKKSFGRMAGLLVTFVIEMIPLVDALPMLTFDTVYNIHSSRAEDRLAFKEQQEAAQKAEAEQAVQVYYHPQAANNNDVGI